MKYLFFMLLLLSGCVPLVRVPSLEEQRQALTLIDKGTQELRNGDLEAAKASFIVALQSDEQAAAYDGLGCVYLRMKEFEQAEKLFIKAYQNDERYSNSLANLALLYELSEQEQKAEEFYRMVLEKDPANFKARNNYAVFLLRKDQSEEIANAARMELLGAKALAEHQTISNNLKLISEE